MRRPRPPCPARARARALGSRGRAPPPLPARARVPRCPAGSHRGRAGAPVCLCGLIKKSKRNRRRKPKTAVNRQKLRLKFHTAIAHRFGRLLTGPHASPEGRGKSAITIYLSRSSVGAINMLQECSMSIVWAGCRRTTSFLRCTAGTFVRTA